ncbi:MAG: DinB family protein [Bryobacteraceae bacterium]|nr:DinB family protein [Bryobacteraceae bacterium]
MYRRMDDFLAAWRSEAESTLKIFHALTDSSLSQRVTPEGRSLGDLAWHIVNTLPEMGGQAGLKIGESPRTGNVEALIAAYERLSAETAAVLESSWTDSMLPEAIPMYGEQWTRGCTLAALIGHQAHHRGQMTVLMRQAGLTVPGVYGPAREEWAAFGMPAEP